MCLSVCICSSLNTAAIDHMQMVSKGAEREAGERVLHAYSVLHDFLKQNYLFKTPKTFAEEGLQIPPENVPEWCCIYSSRGFPTADAVRQEAGQGPPVVLPFCCSLHLVRSFVARKVLQASAAFVSLLITAKEIRLLRCALLFTETRTCFPLVTKHLSGHSHLCQRIAQSCPGTGWEMNGLCSQPLKPCLLFGLIRLS